MSAKPTAAEYLAFREFLSTACGIVLGENKQYLVHSRLNKLMSTHDVESLSVLIKKLEQFSNRSLKEAVVDAMTTNETLWFRDTHPFAIFKDKLLKDLQETRKTIRVWSAACSSGQEPYSISMMVDELGRENLSFARRNVDIVATDISRSMLAHCKEAEYDSLSLGRGLSEQRLKQFFEPLADGGWRVRSNIRLPVRFRILNLMDSFASLGKFDVVFCRNVLIYFSAELKSDILRRIHTVLNPGGHLILGASESLVGVEDLYEMVQCRPGIIYKAK